MLDNETIQDLQEQIALYVEELDVILANFKSEIYEPSDFQESGRIIDALYGVIAMVGNKKLSDYLFTMKQVCYKCSHCESEVAHRKSGVLVGTLKDTLHSLKDDIANQEVLNQMSFQIGIQTSKGEKLLMSYLHSIDTASVEYDKDKNLLLAFDKNSKFSIQYDELATPTYPPIKFTTVHGGFKKELKKNSDGICGVIVNTDCSSRMWTEIIEYTAENAPTAPVFLIGDDAEIPGSIKTNKKIKAVFTPKTRIEAIIRKIKDIKENEESDEDENSEKSSELDDYIRVSAASFSLGAPVDFDVFCIVNDRFVKIVNKGEAFSEDSLETKAAKGVFNYYILKADNKIFFNNLKDQLTTLVNDSADFKDNFISLSDFGTSFFQLVDDYGLNEENVDTAKEFVETSEKTVNQALHSISAREILFDLDTYDHAVSVMLIAGTMLKQIGASKAIYDDIALACLFHDVGIKDKVIKDKVENGDVLTDDELLVYHKHPKEGHDLLMANGIKNQVCEAVLHHHMYIDGTGFPSFDKGKANRFNRIGELISFIEDLLVFTTDLKEKDLCTVEELSNFKLVTAGKFSKSIVDAYDKVYLG